MNDVSDRAQRLERARRPRRAGDGRRHPALGAAADRNEDGDQRVRRGRRRRVGRMRRGRSGGDRRSRDRTASPPQLVHFGIADSEAWDVGLPCGGEIDVWVQSYEPGRFAEIAAAGGRAAEVTLLEGSRPGAKLLLEADGARSGSLGAPGARRRGRARRQRTAVDRRLGAPRVAVRRHRRPRRLD